MDFPLSLFLNAIVAGILLGGFYAAVSIGISISFGMLDIVNIAHPAFIILGSYIAYIVNTNFGFDPIVITLVLSPVFFVFGGLVYDVYYYAFERRGQEALRGLAFFFGIMFITEVTLLLIFGVDYRTVQAVYIGPTITFGLVDLPLRLTVPCTVPCLVSIAMVIAVQLYLQKSFIGRAILAVSQNQIALQLMGANPIRIKRIAFGLSIATAAVAGAFLIVIQPVEPSIGRDYIGRVFAVCVLGGMGSIPGTLLAAIILGIAESFTATFYGPSWAPAVSFGILLLTLGLRPSGLLGR
jgi:branched-chain amino acid transport system permease protein